MLKYLCLASVCVAPVAMLPKVALGIPTNTAGVSSQVFTIGPSSNPRIIDPAVFFNQPQTVIIGPSSNLRTVNPEGFFNRPQTVIINNLQTFSSSDFFNRQTVIPQLVIPQSVISQTVIIDSSESPSSSFFSQPGGLSSNFFSQPQTVVPSAFIDSSGVPFGVNQPFRQFSCSTVIQGSSIPSPVPATSTGQICR